MRVTDCSFELSGVKMSSAECNATVRAIFVKRADKG